MFIQPAQIDSPRTRARIDRPDCSDLQSPIPVFGGADQAQEQGVVMIQDCLQGANQMVLFQGRRDLQEHSLTEAANRAAAFQQPTDDGSRNQGSHADIDLGNSLFYDSGCGGQGLYSLVLEDLARGD